MKFEQILENPGKSQEKLENRRKSKTKTNIPLFIKNNFNFISIKGNNIKMWFVV